MVHPYKRVLNELLVDLFNQILSIQQNRLKSMGVSLSLSEVHVLEAIEKTRDPSMSHIAKRLRITVGTLTTSVKRLVKKGFVERYQTVKDKRKVFLRNTDHALNVLKDHEAFHQAMIDSVTQELDETTLDSTVSAFSKLLAFFKEQS